MRKRQFTEGEEFWGFFEFSVRSKTGLLRGYMKHEWRRSCGEVVSSGRLLCVYGDLLSRVRASEPEVVLIKARQDDFSQLALEMAEWSNAARGSDVLPVLLFSALFLSLQLQTRPLITSLSLSSCWYLISCPYTPLTSSLSSITWTGQMVNFTLTFSNRNSF